MIRNNSKDFIHLLKMGNRPVVNPLKSFNDYNDSKLCLTSTVLREAGNRSVFLYEKEINNTTWCLVATTAEMTQLMLGELTCGLKLKIHLMQESDNSIIQAIKNCVDISVIKNTVVLTMQNGFTLNVKTVSHKTI